MPNLRAVRAEVQRLIMTPSALEPEAMPDSVLMRAKRMGLTTSRMPSLGEGGEALRLTLGGRRGGERWGKAHERETEVGEESGGRSEWRN